MRERGVCTPVFFSRRVIRATMLPGVFRVMSPKEGVLQGTAGIGEGIVIRLYAAPQKHPLPQGIQGEPLIF